MSTTRPGGKPRHSRGFALIVVLWFLVLIAAIGSYLMANARTETAIARNIRASANAEALADAGVAQAVFNLTGTVAGRWKLDGEPHRLKLATGEVSIRVSDETAKINPNHAPPALMTGLFEAAGVDLARARRLGAAMADWVGANMEARPLGAKLQQYQDAGLSYGPPNAPVESLDELQLVLGMTQDIFSAVLPYLTIYTDGEQPDEKNASEIVRRALLLAAREPDDSAGVKDDSAVADSTNAAPSAALPPAAAPAPEAPGAAGANATEAVVDVEVTAESIGGGVFVRHAVLRLDTNAPKGFVVLDWRHGDLRD